MTRIRNILLASLIVAALILIAMRSWVAVDETQFVLITEFGRPVTIYGDDPDEPGFHLRWPWQSSQSIDRRLQVSEPPARETITGDKRNLEVAPFVVWRVSDPVRFLGSAATLDAAGNRLHERVSAALSDAIGRRPLESFASIDPKAWGLDGLTLEVKTTVAKAAQDELGVELIDVRLRRFNHPVEVRPAVFDLIRSERKQVAATLRAEGEAQHQRLTSEADRQRDAILAKADADAERIRGKGEAEATRLLNDAHAKDPKFYEFLRTLETYRAILDEKATVILSSSSPLLRLMMQGPGEELLKDKASGTPLTEEATPRPSAVTPAPVTGASGGKP
jgi:modulator of FtsH protease HflC